MLHTLVHRLEVALEVIAPRGGVLALVAKELGLLVGVLVLTEAARAPRTEFTLFTLKQFCTGTGTGTGTSRHGASAGVLSRPAGLMSTHFVFP